MESEGAADWILGKRVILDCNDCVITAVGIQQLKPHIPLSLEDSSLVTSKEIIYQDGGLTIADQRTSEDHEYLRMMFTGNLQLAVGKVVLASLTLSFHANLPRIHSLEFEGFQSNGVTVIDQPVYWLISQGVQDYGTFASIRVWVELLVNIARPTLGYRVTLVCEPRSYDEARVIDATAILDVGGYQLKWGRGV